ncbi:hypothetical protein W97_03242 [Coniosporium apollinis CBS 100218]|uniref:Cyclin N-terminal domain-containing protein n=1 Tax=Coniosporium apollinis (strain CBS 100218) TaxID=1168221 RepID=R7YQ41_CONA1|nr:uncharacterized protein W97_03242 [Coniosporium apollinis CBS 100218]EON64012.1 hypothetical protein W97_03242 [Coniosporium apollinis CBS 100218]
MPQLAAEITCLFWFENSSTLQQALGHRSPHLPVTPLAADAIPSTGFRKWVTTILATTQVAQNVILLALLFVYRLKQINPAVKGKPGSEYRLLTVALMLGNKFLDDNTYTNKTWAEVSGISVQEVHVMEVEFLSNMKYNLFTSEADWKQWHITLGKFGTFFEKASRASFELTRRPTGLPPPTAHMSMLPSPPASNHASPPFSSNYFPHHAAHSQPPIILPQVTSATVSPLGVVPEFEPRKSRKRSLDEQAAEHPHKRHASDYSHHYSANSSGAMSNDFHRRPSGLEPAHRPEVPVTHASNLPRLALPNLLIPTNQSAQGPPMQLPPQLPPPGGRAMSLVYPPSQQWSQGPSIPSSTTPTHPMGEVSRQLSPYPAGSAGSSPVNNSQPPTSSGNQTHLSPSYFLQQRSSPYRPVRGVTTLLVPPPASMQDPFRHIGFDQMQYQPLGRPNNERRAGPLPYMNHEAWPQTNQFNQWPILPPPNPSR